MVQALERAVDIDAGGGSIDAVIAGTVLFAVFARARVGDLTRCPFEPQLDLNREGGGYVETKFVQHKTARPGAQRSLPITASALGVLGRPWARHWLQARSRAGLRAEDQGTLLQQLPQKVGGMPCRS